jgi:hypothetical protein
MLVDRRMACGSHHQEAPTAAVSVEAILKILILCNSGLLCMFVWHLFKCRDTRVELASMKALMERMVQDIGTHETGMRGTIHKTANEVTALRGEMSMIKRHPR